VKGAGVKNNKSCEPFGVARRIGHADHPTPIVENEGYIFLYVQVFEKRFKVVDALL
jgi:hypothetical protein